MTPAQMDEGYLEAVRNNDHDLLETYVRAVATKRGYDSPVLYHGTEGFGHTKFDIGRSEYGVSIFATDSEAMAPSYTGGMGITMDRVRQARDMHAGDERSMRMLDVWEYWLHEIMGEMAEAHAMIESYK